MSQMHELQSQLLGAFFEESFEGLERLETGLLRLEGQAVEPEVIDDIFRAAHSLKGAAGTFGFGAVTEIAHAMETVLDRIRAASMEPTSEVAAILLAAVDGLRQTLDAHHEGREPNLAPLAPTMKRLAALGERPAGEAAKGAGTTTAPASSAESSGFRIVFRPHPGLLRTGNDPTRLLRELERLAPIDVVADLRELPALAAVKTDECYLAFTITTGGGVTRAALDELFAWVEGDCDLVITPLAPPAVTATFAAAPTATAAREAEAPAEGAPALASIRIGIDKVDLLMNMVGELVITQSMLGELDDDQPLDAARRGRIREGLSQLARNTRALQESVMRLRSMPMSVVFNRFPRLVHDLSRQLGKKVELRLQGQNTELDKTVLEKLGDPLVHLVRNSLDHGLERPEDRIAAGKPEAGVLTLAAHHRGGDIVVEVADDGRGLDLDKILARARERGLVAPDQVLSEPEIRELIFAPGFSTAAAVTDLSGRGVGMDVVRRNVRGLGGEVTIDSEAGRGTRISLRLPLTLAIIDGQLVRVGRFPYVVPLLAIVESVQIEPHLVKRVVGGYDVYRLRDELVPMVPLTALLNCDLSEGAAAEAAPGLLVVVECDGRRVGLVVDEILGLQQIVVKSLEANYERVSGLSGATILGDGNVAFIIDVSGLSKLVRRPAGGAGGTERPN
jgi:two-component system chemotaxis sensor kinase CheA